MDILSRALSSTDATSRRSTSFYIDPKDVAKVQHVVEQLSHKLKDTKKRLEKSEELCAAMAKKAFQLDTAMQLVSAENARLRAYVDGYLSPLLFIKQQLYRREREEAAARVSMLIEEKDHIEESLCLQLQEVKKESDERIKQLRSKLSAAVMRSSAAHEAVGGGAVAPPPRRGGQDDEGEEAIALVEQLDISGISPRRTIHTSNAEAAAAAAAAKKKSAVAAFTPNSRTPRRTVGVEPKPSENKMSFSSSSRGGKSPHRFGQNIYADAELLRRIAPPTATLTTKEGLVGRTGTPPLTSSSRRSTSMNASSPSASSRAVPIGAKKSGTTTTRPAIESSDFNNVRERDMPTVEEGEDLLALETVNCLDTQGPLARRGGEDSSADLERFLSQRDERVSRLERENNRLLRQVTSRLLQK